ncbi:histidine phosphatase family protein [Tropicibacter naphthalenivorans]|uniref:Phosphoglycerate mutase n=1 Tax=Tropicibacter naphthalenivorans TaxID=441103 RepID=A0A0N7LZS0_9RHOB|nr:histidine phosphatase family protein [Tropicibacter naphthalenivorans]CUH78441.1 phosphoglycerate mutase [Tropicibacter naphthalenivorans]SMC80417.1 Broad specificity phosphatase PhoE [Tropicibacter naphthalenivorans]
MSFLTLVRHGQANSTARDEGGYDKLSDLGWQQARWLGDYFRSAGDRYARVYTGTLRRHIETAEAINPDCTQAPVQDARLNEMSYFDLAHALEQQHGIPIPQDREGFVSHLPVLFGHWHDGKIENPPESFQAFETRVRDALTEIAAGDGRALIVTSGGLIGMAMRIVMGLDLTAMAHACLAIENSSVHRVQPLPTGLALTQFNALPHLDTPDRQHARSHL